MPDTNLAGLGLITRLLSYVAVGALVLCGFIYFIYIGYHLLGHPTEGMAREIRKNGVQTLGLPISALASFALVIALPAALGEELKFSMAGAEVKGPASQILFWVLCFLTFNFSIWLTHQRGKAVQGASELQSSNVSNLLETLDNGIKESHSAQSQLADVIETTKAELDSISGIGEIERRKTQKAMERMSKMMSTLSDLLKKISDTSASITQNLK